MQLILLAVVQSGLSKLEESLRLDSGSGIDIGGTIIIAAICITVGLLMSQALVYVRDTT